jgi:polyhydroxybutyrate depolymerase
MRLTLWFFSILALICVIQPTFAQEEIRFEERTLTYDGLQRRYLVYVPPQYDASQPVPLVFVLHGGGGNPEMYEEVTHFGEKAREEGFILVYPAGTGRLRGERLLTWNAGHCCAYAFEQDVDDVGFFRTLVTQIQDEFAIDADRIYVAGHSNGAMMAYRLAAEMSDVFAAAGIVSGTIGGYPTPESDTLYIIPQPEQAVSIIHIHGMADENVRYEGGVNKDNSLSRRSDLSVAESIRFWVEADQCDTDPTQETRDGEMVLVETYACPASGTTVELISIKDGGHAWPGGSVLRRGADRPSLRVNATDELWAFFSAHPRQVAS